MNTPRIVIIGHVCIDTNTTESTEYTGWGSTVLYMANYLRQQGYGATIITNYGPDVVPYLPPVTLLSPQPTRKQTLRYENDTRQVPRIRRAHNTEYADAPEVTEDVKKALGAADIVVIATLLPNYSAGYIKEIRKYCNPNALTMLCPQGYFHEPATDGVMMSREFVEAHEIIPEFDIVIYSEEDHPRAHDVARQRSLAAVGTKIIVTQGEHGASIYHEGTVQHIPTLPIAHEDIIDSVGCGDIFDAAVALEYWKTHELTTAVRHAHQAAARKLRASGPVNDLKI